ncbi:trichohyalin-like, partial [Anneissia japonica]|uniref:trichohyalin-like n=1 Tax=Anneissia japonica TaxID=1529436 RepID=UPI0014254D04
MRHFFTRKQWASKEDSLTSWTVVRRKRPKRRDHNDRRFLDFSSDSFAPDRKEGRRSLPERRGVLGTVGRRRRRRETELEGRTRRNSEQLPTVQSGRRGAHLHGGRPGLRGRRGGDAEEIGRAKRREGRAALRGREISVRETRRTQAEERSQERKFPKRSPKTRLAERRCPQDGRRQEEHRARGDGRDIRRSRRILRALEQEQEQDDRTPAIGVAREQVARPTVRSVRDHRRRLRRVRRTRLVPTHRARVRNSLVHGVRESASRTESVFGVRHTVRRCARPAQVRRQRAFVQHPHGDVRQRLHSHADRHAIGRPPGSQAKRVDAPDRKMVAGEARQS